MNGMIEQGQYLSIYMGEADLESPGHFLSHNLSERVGSVNSFLCTTKFLISSSGRVVLHHASDCTNRLCHLDSVLYCYENKR